MPTEKFNIQGKSAQEAAKTQAATGVAGRYSGPTPPVDTYQGTCRFLHMTAKPNKNGDPMIRGGVVINEPAGSSKAKYNGYVINFRLNVSDQGIPYVNQFLDAISGGKQQVKDRFWGNGGVTTAKADKGKDRPITIIGGLKVPDKGGFPVVVTTSENNYTGADGKVREQLQVGAFLLKVSGGGPVEVDDDVDDVDDVDEDVDTDDDFNDVEDDADEEVQDADDEDADDEDEESTDDDEEDDAAEEEGDDGPSEEEREAEIRKALAGLDRNALKERLRGLSPSAKILKRHTDDDLRNQIVELEMSEPPF